jgi:PAS domain S-box-containing protein
VVQLDGGALAGYVLLDDLTGSPTVLARVAPSSDTAAPAVAALADLERLARDAGIWLGAMLLGSALIVLGTTLLVQEVAVLRRTAALATRLAEIASSPAPGARVESHGDDELARLEISANELIAALEGATRQAADRERMSAASAERTRLALQATAQVAFDVDVQGGRISLDGAVLRLTGYSLEELRSVPLSTWESMLYADDRLAAVTAGEQAASTGAAYRIEYRLRRKDGTYATVEERGARAPGAAPRIVGTMRIVTSRHAEEPPVPAPSAPGPPPSPGSPV